jgi:outer membrane biosynthesis protein TonB
VARRTQPLRPHLNQIRTWARQGRTDIWIAHTLETKPEVVAAFRAEHGIERRPPGSALPPISAETVALETLPEGPLQPREPSPEPAGGEAPVKRPRRRRVKDAVIDPVPEPAPAAAEEAADEPAKEPKTTSRRRSRAKKAPAAPEPVAEAPPAEVAPAAPEEAPKRSRRRRRKSGAAALPTASLQAGVVVVLEASVADDPTFKEHWADAGKLIAEVGEDAIVLRRDRRS